ncbi:TIGR03503 family protein [Dongshaea marina]|uniref:TIGR03503 family protein n=1 Tax=Dongshaea marina TaxID=2047966 RepID=UPI000D3E35CC|nr:TIGR03503 family protein [Dongshaea marina]
MSRGWLGLIFFWIVSATANEVFAPSDIPLLNNRFRLDYGITEITFFIARKPGSNPAILVRPNGSKIYANQTPKNVRWLQLDDRDIITITSPMAGPWQALGEIDQDNRIRLISDLSLKVDPIPRKVYQGEQIKLTGRLFHKGKLVTDKYYLSDVGMTIRAASSAVEGVEDLGRVDKVLGRYKDDGKGIDERPADGVVTTQAILAIPGGKYRVFISTGNEVFTRAVHQELLVYPAPAAIDILPIAEGQDPVIKVAIDEDEIKPGSAVLQGQVLDSQGKVIARLDGRNPAPELEMSLPRPQEYGQYSVRMTMYASTLDQREIVVSLPEKSFYLVEPFKALASDAVATDGVLAGEAPDQEKEPFTISIWVWMSLAAVVAIGVILTLIVLLKRRALKRLLEEQRLEEQKQQESEAEEEKKDDQSLESIDLNIPEQ